VRSTVPGETKQNSIKHSYRCFFDEMF